MPSVVNGTSVRVVVSDEVYERYEKQSKASGKPVEELMGHQLWRFRDVESKKPVLLDDAARQWIERLLHRNFSTANELVSYLQSALTVTVDDLAVQLSPDVLSRLKSRAIGVPFDAFLKRLVQQLLGEYVGL